MKFENTEVWGFNHALRGMRNPMNSWNKSDSKSIYPATIDNKDNLTGCHYLIGANDMKLAQQLIRSGSEHRKFMRQIFVSVDITAPLYWWKECDQYKIGVTTNSCSTMHKLVTTPITLDCFETDDYKPNTFVYYENTTVNDVIDTNVGFIHFLETLRQHYLETKDKGYWKELIRWLPESWLQKRTITMSYENLYTVVHQRKNHKLSEWSVSFMNWVRTLPYAQELIFINKTEE